MITFFLIVVGAALVFGSGVILLSLADAPEGWEDGNGFHLGTEPVKAGRDFLASPPAGCRDDGEECRLR